MKMVKAKREWGISVNTVWQKSYNILNDLNNYAEVSICKKCEVQTFPLCFTFVFLFFFNMKGERKMFYTLNTLLIFFAGCQRCLYPSE